MALKGINILSVTMLEVANMTGLLVVLLPKLRHMHCPIAAVILQHGVDVVMARSERSFDFGALLQDNFQSSVHLHLRLRECEHLTVHVLAHPHHGENFLTQGDYLAVDTLQEFGKACLNLELDPRSQLHPVRSNSIVELLRMQWDLEACHRMNRCLRARFMMKCLLDAWPPCHRSSCRVYVPVQVFDSFARMPCAYAAVARCLVHWPLALRRDTLRGFTLLTSRC
mmetsp:Transcript_62129/g.110858  ORF Transcript_62129/g.110858 Transcript_62129/m.110858 type:complete len:225 (+) Transcript_62129:982-1656(+)